LSNISSLEESNNAFRRDEIDTYNMTIKSGMKLTRPGTNTEELVYQKISIQLPIYKTLKNEYARTYELSFGATFMPSVIFYDPNPYNTGWGGAFDLTYSRNRFNAYAGVGISRFKDKGSWQVNYETYDSVGYFNNINSFRVDPANPGKVIFETSQETVYDSVPHVVIEEKTNIYTYVDIPVGIGLTFLSNKRWSLMARTGIIYSLMVGKREPTASIDVQAASEIRFNRKVPSRVNSTWRFTAGLEVGYLLTDRLTIRLEPTYEQYLNSIYMNSPNYQAKKPYLIGVNVGLRYRIK
jgi:hypothetical protein